MERILITFNRDGTFRGASNYGWDGMPAPLDVAALAALFPDLNAAAVARVGELEAAANESAAKDAQIAQLEARIAELTAPQNVVTIRAWQAKAVLALSGLLEAAEQVIAALDEPQRTVVQSAWANNADFSRQSPTILSLAAALQITEEQLDAMFEQGAALTV